VKGITACYNKVLDLLDTHQHGELLYSPSICSAPKHGSDDIVSSNGMV
jgi:hypothetical protein